MCGDVNVLLRQPNPPQPGQRRLQHITKTNNDTIRRFYSFITRSSGDGHCDNMYPIKPHFSPRHPLLRCQQVRCRRTQLERDLLGSDEGFELTARQGHRGRNNQHTLRGGNHFVPRHCGLLIPESELSHNAITLPPLSSAAGQTAGVTCIESFIFTV